jgi:hypothetical protein
MAAGMRGGEGRGRCGGDGWGEEAQMALVLGISLDVTRQMGKTEAWLNSQTPRALRGSPESMVVSST